MAMKKLMYKIAILLSLVIFECTATSSLVAEPNPLALVPIYQYDGEDNKVSFSEYQSKASTDVENKLAQMTLDEKIGQLFNIRVMSNTSSTERLKAKALIKDYHVGGITFFRDTKIKSSPVQQAKITNELQALSKYPLMVAIDGEWGLNMRLDSTIQLPRQLTLGAIQDNQLVYEMGQEVGRQMKRMGIHMNFAPVIDVNNNPNNPVINDRSFGEDIYNVSQKGIAYMNGMHDAGILATAKHFPGHGDTNVDSHKDLPVIYHNRRRLDSLELYPFRQLVNNRLGAMMIAHLSIPELDARLNRPTTLSSFVVNDLLRRDMGFDGLVITDAMEMQGVTKHFPTGRAEIEALLAGNDIILLSNDVPLAINAIKAAVSSGELSESRINDSVRRILSAKRWMGILDSSFPVDTRYITSDLNRSSAKLLNKRLFERAMTLVKNNDALIPMMDLGNKKIATISIDDGKITPFQKALDPYAPMKHFYISANATESAFSTLLSRLSYYDVIIVGKVNKSRYASRSFGISLAEKSFIRQLSAQKRTILTVFGNPYSLDQFADVPNLICAYDDSDEAQISAAEGIFGVNGFSGRTPVASGYLSAGLGQNTTGGLRMKYTIPEELGLSSYSFRKVDSIANAAIRIKATPGCQILIAKDNKVIYNKSFGYHTYDKRRRVQNSDLYDLASITKIAASVPSIMKAYEDGQMNVNDRLSQHYPRANGTNKSNFVIGEIMNHTAGYRSWIPFYKKTMDKRGNLNQNYKKSKASGYDLQIANNLYLKDNYPKDSIINYILEEDNNARGRYVYSDLGYYIFKDIIEQKYNQSFTDFTNENFYKPLGLKTLTYNPLQSFEKSRITPSEKDDYWRNQTVQGHVHDMGAAMQGGVGGHAGLFSNANDLAIYMQMLMNGGQYGGQTYFQSSTIDYFTRKYNGNSRRALGFDKAELTPNKIGPTGDLASANSFGHTGFTGTYAWADPDHNLIYIFLSNRTYPSASNRKLISEGSRTQIQDAIYEIIGVQNR